MKAGPILAAVLLAGCGSHPPRPHAQIFFTPPDPGIVGKTTEAELIARRGPPLSQMTGTDGTHTYVYYALIVRVADLRSLAKPDPSNSGPPAAADGTNGLPKTNIEYVFSSDGILREIRMEVPYQPPKS